MSDSLWPHGLQHARLPCPSLSPGGCSNSCLLGWRCHPAISSPDAFFSFCHPSFPASGSFPVSQLFTSGGQSIGASASALVLAVNIQDWFPLGWTGWISLQSKGLSRIFSSTTVQKHQFFSAQSSLWSNSHIHAQLLEKTIVLTRWTFVINSVCVSIPSTLSYLFSFFLSLLLTLMCSLNPFRGLPERPSSALLSLPWLCISPLHITIHLPSLQFPPQRWSLLQRRPMFVCLCFLTSGSRKPMLSRLNESEVNTWTNSLHLMNIFMRLNTRLHICTSCPCKT